MNAKNQTGENNLKNYLNSVVDPLILLKQKLRNLFQYKLIIKTFFHVANYVFLGVDKQENKATYSEYWTVEVEGDGAVTFG